MKTKLIFIILFGVVFGFIANSQTTTFQWAKSIGGTGSDYGYSIAIDGSGNVYTIGTFQGTTDLDPGAGIFNLISAGADDIFISKIDSSGNFIWGKGVGGASADNGKSIALDSLGNLYATGWFKDTVDFDPGAGVYNLSSSFSNDNLFILKLDGSGNFVWVKSISDTLNSYGLSVTVDVSGNVYSAGGFEGTADFDPGAGVFTLSALTGSYDIFISKLDPSGNFIWAKNMGGVGIASANAVKTDAAGNVYSTGVFEGTVDYDPGAGVVYLTADSGSYNVFISKLDSSGNFAWAKRIGGTPLWDCLANALAIDTSGNVYSTGSFQLIADFDPGPGTYNLTAPSYGALFISKLDSSGNFVWAKSIEGTGGTDRGNAICLDSANNIYTTGLFLGTTDFDPNAGVVNLTSKGSLDIFVLKLDLSGNFIWVKQIGGNGYDQGFSIALDIYDNIYTTGIFQNTADFDSGPNVYNITATGGQDAFIHKMSPSISFDGVADDIHPTEILIYPNLTHDLFNVVIESPANNSLIEVYNSTGVMVYKSKLTPGQTPIDLIDHASGLYIVKIIIDDRIIKVQKIVKQ